MFSEYASRFLAQSQSQISAFAGQQRPDTAEGTLPGSGRAPQNDWSARQSRPAFQAFLSRGPYVNPGNQRQGNPYQQNGSRFGFASHISAAQDAPLFRSVNSDLRSDPGDDDEYDDDREARDFLALQRSRRVAGASKLAESSENEQDASHASLERSEAGVFRYQQEVTPPSGFRANWARRPFGGNSVRTTDDLGRSNTKGKGRAEMVDVGLDSHMDDHEDDDDYDNNDDIPESLLAESVGDNLPPAFQKFKTSTRPQDHKAFPTESEFETMRGSFDTELDASRATQPLPTATTANSRVPATVPLIEGEWFKYDGFFACAFIILQFALISTFALVWLQTTTPSGPIGDTIYTVLRSSFNMLAVDTLVAVVVALFWLAALRSFVWPLTIAIIFATPVVLISFSLYPFVASFKGDTHGGSVQDRVMRWAAIVPAALAVLWVYLVLKGRRAIRQAVHILEFSSRILAANPALLMLGLSCLGLIVVWTWVWLVMFNRIFLEGHFSRSLARWVMSVSSWWLGAWFVFMHMWTVSIITGVQQAATAATVSQWYFHRNAGPASPSNQVVYAAVWHAITKIFGSICESTLLSLLVRVPLLILPGRASIVVSRIMALWIPTPVVALTNPLTITFSAIHSQGLGYSAKGISQMDFLSPQVPTTTLIAPGAVTLYPWGSRGGHAASPLLPYRLAKTILAGTRYLMATALGFAGWVLMAKNMQVSMPDGIGWRGSAYAYIVGMVASFIGLYIMGTMEGVLSGIVDAVVVCYGSERRMLRGVGASAGAYCMEAAYLFGDRRRPGEGDDEEVGRSRYE